MRRSEHLDHRRSLASWHVSATDLEDAFSGLAGSMEMQELTTRLRHLLVERVSGGEMVENLEEVVESAVARHIDEHGANTVLP